MKNNNKSNITNNNNKENVDNSCNLLTIRNKPLFLDCSDNIFSLFNNLPTSKPINTTYSKTNLNPSNEILTMNIDDLMRYIHKSNQNKKYNTNKHLKNITAGLDDKIGSCNLTTLNTPQLVTINNNVFKAPSVIYKQPEIPNLEQDESMDNVEEKKPIPEIIKKKVDIQCEIESLSDILKLINDYPIKDDVEYNINMEPLHNIKKHLEELNNMIGMTLLKNSVVDQIIYFIQGLDTNMDFMHTVIFGPPGTGKTEVAKIIGKIFSTLGILKNNKFKKVTRSDLIAGYLGQTAMKTRDVIKSCIGGVVFIDEAYALGNNEKKDSFSKECIDTLCELLSDYKSDIMVIIAGYEKELNDCFFAYNEGLNSRFPWRFHTDDYSPTELKNIFVKKIKDIKWKLNFTPEDKWFEERMDCFKYYGRDIETLLSKIKIAHARRVFCLSNNLKTILTIEDINKGFNLYLDNNKEAKDKNINKNDISLSNMYL